MSIEANDNRKQRGIMLVMFAISVPVLFGLATLALDAGNLYLTRLRLDKAVRESAGTALSMMSLSGWGSLVTEAPAICDNRDCGLATGDKGSKSSAQETARTTAILAAMKNIVQQTVEDIPAVNIESVNYRSFSSDNDDPNRYGGWKDSKAGFIADAISLNGTTSVGIGVTVETDTLLLGTLGAALPGLQDACTGANGRCRVSSTPITQAGTLQPANIFLLLDTSGSMANPAGPNNANGPTKMDALVGAVSNFIDMFNPSNDQISIINFATTATQNPRALATFADGTGDLLQIKQDVAALAAGVGGMTNPCDALIGTINNLPANGNPTFVVLFTDGAPNVYRMNFCQNNNGNCGIALQSNANRLEQQVKTANQDPNVNLDPDAGWYGWTVNWGRRLTYCTEGQIQDGFNCDPVFSYPKLIRDGSEMPEAEARKATLNADGIFEIATESEETSEIKLAFAPNTPQNYKWYGPSYLVHASEIDSLQGALIDRIPRDVNEAPVTCGPGSRAPYRGSAIEVGDGKTMPDNFNHSRYFASRVLDQQWNLNSNHLDLAEKRRTLLGLDQVGGTYSPGDGGWIEAPPYYPDRDDGKRPQIGHGDAGRSGCLRRLSGFLPVQAEARIFLGNRFISNTDVDSVQQVGEIVKTAELPYYCAIRAADILRQQGVRVFTVGLGPPAANLYGQECNDPLENALDFDSRKDRFLTRLALDPNSLATPANAFGNGDLDGWAGVNFTAQNTQIACNNHPLNGRTVNLGYGEFGTPDAPLSRQPAQHGFTQANVGGYYATNDPAQLRGVFGEVAKRILLDLSL